MRRNRRRVAGVNIKPIGRGHLSVLGGHSANIYHGEVALPHGAASTVAERARPLQGVATAFAAIQGNVFLAPRYSATARRTG